MLNKKTIFIIIVSLLAFIFIIYLISIMISSNSNLSDFVILPLQSTISISDLTSLINNNLRTTITISDQNQEVDLFFISNDFSFYVTQQDIFFENNDNSKINKLANNFYDYEISSSIEIISNRTQMVFTNYKFARKAKENFALCSKNNCNKNSININDFYFMLAEDPFTKVSGGIGLGLNEYIGDGAINFFNELYRRKYIKNNVWFIDYGKNEEKKLVIGKFPYEVDKKYKKDDFEFIELENKGNFWELKMSKISIGYIDEYENENSDNILKDKDVQFMQEYSGIYGPPDYYNKIKNIFFNKYLNNQCTEKSFNYQLIDYLYIVCNEDISLKDFPPLVLDINKNVRLELTYNELFWKSNGQILFLFISNKIEKYFNGKWYFGEPLLKKYIPVYNQREYKIGFYESIINKKRNYKVAGIWGFIILIISIGVIIYLCLFIFRKYRNRKIRRAAMEMRIEEISSKFILNKNENK